jgi:hypothetical protein
MVRRRPAYLIGIVSCVLVVLATSTAFAQLPDTVATRGVEIWSDGTRLAGDLFWPKIWKQGEKLPAIVLCGGWGSLKSHLNGSYGPAFASAFLCGLSVFAVQKTTYEPVDRVPGEPGQMGTPVRWTIRGGQARPHGTSRRWRPRS